MLQTEFSPQRGMASYPDTLDPPPMSVGDVVGVPCDVEVGLRLSRQLVKARLRLFFGETVEPAPT
jgi:hypothetical protein